MTLSRLLRVRRVAHKLHLTIGLSGLVDTEQEMSLKLSISQLPAHQHGGTARSANHHMERQASLERLCGLS